MPTHSHEGYSGSGLINFEERPNECRTTGPSTPLSTSPCSPSSESPTITSPIITSPFSTLRRRHHVPSDRPDIRRAWSCASWTSQEQFTIQSDVRTARNQSPPRIEQKNILYGDSIFVKIIGWYPMFLLRIAQVILVTVSQVTITRILLTLPSLWFHIWFICLWKILQIPSMVGRGLLNMVNSAQSTKKFKPKTVLISGGSTMQALHLARNFYSAGANVIICEVEGVFCFTRFSTAVSKFYTLPRPNLDNYKWYIKALGQIVQKENVNIYVPVSSTTPAFYDALAKPHLELLGCSCFCPGVKEVLMLDDPFELLRRCQYNRTPTPRFYHVQSKDEVLSLYDEGVLQAGRFVMYKSGVQEKIKYELPITKAAFKLNHEVNRENPWVIIQTDMPGKQFVTCTTVKDSHVIANVVCELTGPKTLLPVENPAITAWVKDYIRNLKTLRPITAHLSFRFVVDDTLVLPLNCRVGVSIAYICHTSLHPQAISKPSCRHFRSTESLIVTDKADKFLDGVDQSCRDVIPDRIFSTVIDKRDALFVFWDPLPYCIHYHMQLPLRNIIDLVHHRPEADAQHEHFTRTLAASVH